MPELLNHIEALDITSEAYVDLLEVDLSVNRQHIRRVLVWLKENESAHDVTYMVMGSANGTDWEALLSSSETPGDEERTLTAGTTAYHVVETPWLHVKLMGKAAKGEDPNVDIAITGN